MSKPRVLVIGLDGATFDLLRPLMASGVMPFLSSLAAEGAHGSLLSTVPPLTAPAWASFITGVNPARHGIFEFTHRPPGQYNHTPVNASLLQAPTLWGRLSRAGLRLGVINVPITYPPEPVNGFLISGLETPRGARDFTHPPALLAELESRFGPYPLHHRQVYTRGNAGAVLQEARAILEYRLNTARHLIQNSDWDFAMVYYHGTDRVQHELWHILDTTHPAHDRREAARYEPEVLDFFRAVDDFVRELAGLAPDGTNLIVMSDHGFGPIRKFVNFNVWLLQQGFLKLKDDAATRLKYLAFRAGLTPALAYRWAMRLGFAHLRLAAGMTKRAALLSLLDRVFLSFANVDWARTRAYSRGNWGQIFVNLEGREPRGSVPLADYEATRDLIAARLRLLADPETGNAVVARVLRAEDVYHGALKGLAPDLLPIPHDLRYKPLGTVSFTSHQLIEPVFGNSGDHRMEGVVFLRGPAIGAGQSLAEANIMDLAPTILHLLDQPVPPDLDGAVLAQAFTSDYAAAHPVRWGERLDEPEPGRLPSGYTPAEEAQVIEQLRELGYEA